jgi:hypothetical protein
MSSLPLQVLRSYRQLLRSRKLAFASDPRALASSAVELRRQFEANRGLADAHAIEGCLQGCRDVDDMLRNGLVQGEVVEEAP